MRFRTSIILAPIALAAAGIFLLGMKDREVEIARVAPGAAGGAAPEFLAETLPPREDIEFQPPLENPPAMVKAIYATNWSAGSEKKISSLIDLIRGTELNAIVIDIKDYSGIVGYKTDVAFVKNYGAEEKRILKINTLLKRLHDQDIYVIGRLSVFQDQALIAARPDLAVQSKESGKPWRDRKNLGWADQSSREVWDYNIAIAKDALARGFDEINFDYIRFESDGDLGDALHPFWDGTRPMREVMREFFAYLRDNLPDARISIDLFGQVTTETDDMGIGQYLEDATPYFDFIAPMVYPSHYAPNFLGYARPAAHPYEVVFHSISSALGRMNAQVAARAEGLTLAGETLGNFVRQPIGKLRPWIQDFSLGAVYTPGMVRAEISALMDAASTTADAPLGYMLWNPSNIYSRDALEHE